MTEWLGSIGWRTEVDTTGAHTGVARTEAELEAAMARIDRMEGTAKARIRTADLDKDIAAIKAKLAALERKKVNIMAHIDERARRGVDQTRLSKALSDVNDEMDEHRLRIKEVNAEKAQMTAYSRRLAAEMKAEEDRVHGANRAFREHRVEIESLRDTYAKLQRQHRFMYATDPNNRTGLARLATQMDLVRTKIAAYGSDVEDINEDVTKDVEEHTRRQEASYRRRERAIESEAAALDKARIAYARHRSKIDELDRKGSRGTKLKGSATAIEAAEWDRSQREVVRLRTEIDRLGGSTIDLDRRTSHSGAALRRWGSNLLGVRVHMGVMSLSVKQFGIALVSLGPIVTGLIGSLSALIGVLSQGIGGAAVLGGAALTGFVTSMGAAFLAVRPFVKELGTAMEATKKYNDAVREFGKNSEEAKTAQQEMREVLKNQPKDVQQVARAFGELGRRWERLTKGAREPFFDTIKNGLQTVEKLLPAFAENAVNAVKAIAEGSEYFFSQLEGPIGKTLDNIMDRFTAHLPSIMRGFTDLTEGLLNVFDSAGRVMYGSGFEDWARGFRDATRDVGSLDAKMREWHESLKSTMGFLGSTGGLLAAFFGTGAETGRSILDDLSKQFDDWSDSINTVTGQNNLREWFDDAYETTKRFFGAVESGIKLIGNLATAFEDPMRKLLDITNKVADVMATVAGWPIIGELSTGLLAGAAAFGIGKKLLGATGITAGFTAMGSAAKKARTALVPLGGAMGTTAGAAGKAGKAAKVAGDQFGVNRARAVAMTGATAASGGAMASAASKAGALGKGLLAVGARAAGFLTPVGLAVTGGFLLAEAFGLFGDSSEETVSRLEQMNPGLRDARVSLLGVGQASLNSRNLMMELSKELQGSGPAAEYAANTVRQSFGEMKQSIAGTRESLKELWSDPDAMIGDLLPESLVNRMKEFAPELLDPMADSLKENGRLTKNWQERLRALGASDEDIKNINAALRPTRDLMNEAARATAKLALNQANLRRHQKGMETLGMGARQAMQDLARQGFKKDQIVKWSVQLDDREAQTKLLRLISWSKGELGKGATMRILANSKNADDALERLQRAKRQAEKPANVKVGAKVNDAISGIGNVIKSIGKVPDRKDSLLNAINKASPVAGAVARAITAVPGGKESILRAVDRASSIASSIGNIIRSIPQTWTTTITTIAKTVGKAVGVGATGGTLTTTGRDKVDSFATGGGFIDKPAFVVGEEAPQHPEFVIATNPRYRRQNVRYLIAAATALGIPGFAGGGMRGYKTGAIPPSSAQREYDRANKDRDRAKDRHDRAKDRNKQIQKRKGAPAREKRRAEREEEQTRRALRKAEKRRDRAKRAMKYANRAAKRFETERKEIELAEAQAAAHAASGNTRQWEWSRDKGIKHINRLIERLRRAGRGARGHHKLDLQTEIAGLVSRRESLKEGRPGIEGMLTKGEATALSGIERAIAEARLTPDALDDQMAQRGLQDFWQGVYGRLRRPGSGASNEQIAEAANRLADARESALTGGGAGAIIPQSAIFDTARLDLYKQFGSNTSFRQARIDPWGGRGAGGGAQITNNFAAPPPDPHTWSQQQAYEVKAL